MSRRDGSWSVRARSWSVLTRSLSVLACTMLLTTACANADDPDPAPAITPTGEAPVAATNPNAIAPTSEAPVAPGQSQTAATSKFDSTRAWEHLRRQVALGPRPAGSATLADCRRYIVSVLKAIGLDAREQAFDGETPTGRIRMVNLVATIPGRRVDRIVVATHYDTKLFKDIRFVGASDAASSTAAVLELARALTTIPHDYTIELLFLDGEEAVVEWQGNDHTYGSRYYVEAARAGGTLSGIKALVLLDMIGDRNLDVRRDANSTPWLVDLVWESAAKLGYRSTFVDELTNIEDDHIPFVRAGIPSVDIIDLNYPAWHTAQDDLDHVTARSLQIVGDVVLDALPRIEQRLTGGR